MSIDFTPSMKPYKSTGSFKFWCQKVLPLVYDDSLSYYELLCKVVNYLNDVISNCDNLNDNVTNLFNAYNELQEFVNEYFDNLDVQNEINNKLDSMAENGTLNDLLQRYSGTIMYSPISFAHMFGMSGNFANNIGNNAFMGQAIVLNNNVGYECMSTKRTYQIISGNKYYFYCTVNSNDRNITPDRPSKLTFEFYAHDGITIVASKEFEILNSGVQPLVFIIDWNDPKQNVHENGLEYTYFIKIKYDCVITSELAPSFLLSNLRCSINYTTSGQCQPLLPVVNKQLPTYSPNFTIAEGSRFDYDGGILRFAAKFTCVNSSVALVQLPSLYEAFITKGLNQFFRCKIYNVTQDKEHWLKLDVFGEQPWLSFGNNDNRPSVGDELVLECCVPWITQPDMMLYDIEL